MHRRLVLLTGGSRSARTRERGVHVACTGLFPIAALSAPGRDGGRGARSHRAAEASRMQYVPRSFI